MRLPHLLSAPLSTSAARRVFLARAVAGALVLADRAVRLPRSAFAEETSTTTTTATATIVESPAGVPDWDVPGGHFYTQAAPSDAPADTGYVVSDADGQPFWSEYRELGGPAQLGFPMSARYEGDDGVYQVAEVALLRWDPATARVGVAPVFSLFAARGLDGWLEAQGLPPTSSRLLEDPAIPAETRLSWLTHPALRTAYLTPDEAAGQQRFGLPMGEPERFGPYLAQRFENAIMQLWLDDVPGQPRAGTVSLALAGDLLRAAGLIPEAALVPATPPAPPPAPEPAMTPTPNSAADAELAALAQDGRKRVVVSVGRQWWFAYQDGALRYSGPVTTGQPELFTPTGSYRVLSKHSPFTFISPWPPGSKYWYPPSPATYALRITANGVFLHDAPWRPYYGPGTNVPHYDPDGVWRTGSHGCINMPFAAAQWLWNFAPVDTPVDVVA